MKNIFSNISTLLLAILVIFLSVGFSVSKMQCSKDGKIFIGTEVPNCMQEKETFSIDELKKMSCCASDKNLQSCCPQTEDDSCASETTDIQFDFETLTSSYLLNVEERSTLVYTCLLFEKLYILEHHFASLKEIPLPPNINKPKLSQIQSFLL